MKTFFDDVWLKSASENELKEKISEIKSLVDFSIVNFLDTYRNEMEAIRIISDELTIRPFVDYVKVVRKNEQVNITINYKLWSDITKMVNDWPDIISNEENLKTLADINMTDTKKIIDITNALVMIFSLIGGATTNNKEGIIRVLPNIYE